MTREDVKKILPEISDEQLGGIMKLHGDDITSYKTKIETLEGDIKVKDGVISQKNTRISELEDVDIEKLKEAEFKRGKAEGAAELEKYKFDNALDAELTKSGAKNAKVLRALLKLDDIKLDGETFTGLSEQLEQIKTDNGYLFENSESTKPAFSSGIESRGGEITKEAFGKMGYKERLNLFNDNPELYNELSK